MMRRLIQKPPSRGIHCWRSSQHRSPTPHFLVSRSMSRHSGGDDDDSRMQDIYSNLFGDDGAEGYGPGTGSSGNRREENKKAKRQAVEEEVQVLPVRLWADNLEISDEEFSTKWSFDDIPDWSPDFVSRISKERIKLHPEGIPTLKSLSSLPLPPPPFPHPGHGQSKEYAVLRRKAHREYIKHKAIKLAEPKVSQILSLPTWQEKQDAVDELFESVEFQLRDAEPVLQGHPKFGLWVERALESYLKSVAKNEQESLEEESKESTDAGPYPDEEEDQNSVPVFMDCYSDKDGADKMVPSILTPLKPHHNMGPGRMVEEWELSAHSGTKRIMLRQSTRAIARALEESASARVFVTGRRGVGKSAAIATIVASARKSGQIVLYMPDGNRLHRHGYYIQPNPKLKDLYDLPVLSQEICNELLAVHESDLQGMEVDEEVMKAHFTDIQLESMSSYSGGKISLVDLLKAAQADVGNAAMCFTIVVDYLMKQEEKPFLMALDEFNCYFEPGHYFHMDYDNDVNEAIPYDKINLFKPALDAIALSLEDDEDIPLKTPSAPKKGGVVAGVSESCAVARLVTDSLVAYANRSSKAGSTNIPLSVIEVPRFSEVEVDHVLSNYECIGIGNLRCDQGATVMNEQGVKYLKMVSGKVGQELLDVCCS